MTLKSPCFNCNDRTAGCHTACKKGIEYLNALKHRNEAIKAERDKELAFNEYKGERVYATKKRYGIE